MFTDTKFDMSLCQNHCENEEIEWIRASRIASMTDDDGDVTMVLEEGSSEYSCNQESNPFIESCLSSFEPQNTMFECEHMELGICAVTLFHN